ncbi:hypothetical protein ACIBQX_18980 [Nonomuraea sp. NPDC049714]|uniref:hypothetical protein n=1 Tax=Nonomuraea sp. NPDC049714 TaxID=3364357 RepID=UPI0037901CEB
MTGPEHYQRAENLLRDLTKAECSMSGRTDQVAMERTLAKAQVHATLALAAATALNDYPEGAPIADIRAWRATAGTPEEGTR